ncbi:MAG: bacteriohemerythrin [Proteobacteria bacterium]|nr:bacteriohemerythrin [Pseudomonadota bacterium]
MQNLVWNDGLSVGIDSIDNDHKNLLSLFNELSNAILSNHTSDVIENIFIRLEEYVVIHFTREEALMKQCHYPDLENHIKLHQAFVNKVPELKHKLLTADSIKVAQEVNLFLYNWLMNHIIGEDLNFAQQAYEYNLANDKPDKVSFFKGISNWLSKHLVLNSRIAITALFPIFALFVLSFFTLLNTSKELLTLQHQLDFIPLVHQINSLTHNLQTERGLTTAFLGSKNNVFHSRLTKQYEITNTSIIQYKQGIDQLGGQAINKEMREHLIRSENYFVQLLEQRKAIEQSKSKITFTFYNDFIASLLAVPESMTHQKMDSKMAHNLTAITAILNLKETAGIERALGTLAIEQGHLPDRQLHPFIQLIGQQKGFVQNFQHAATDQQRSQLRLGCKEGNIQAIEQELYLSAMKNTLSNMDSQHWFKLLSCRMDQLKTLANYLIDDFKKQSDSKVNQLKRQLYLIGIILISVLALTSFSFWILKRSIIFPIAHLTHALHDLAFGNKKVRLKDKFANDELGELLESYEKCRRRLLQADISSSVDFIRLGVELDDNTRKKDYYEKLSSTDPLTGAVNRRKLNHLAALEIDRLSRFNRNLSVLMLDIDYFKKINDSYGHAAGDQVLIAFYQSCQKLVRKIDTLARIGGEEFVILMPETDLQQASTLAERIRSTIDKQILKVDNQLIKYTVSIGVATWDSLSYKDFDDFLHCADQRLYKAKESGRNRVVSHI